MFSVLIANYNNGQYLQEALDSVFAQTYKEWEIVIVDDGSTDESCKIYERYADDERIHIFHNGHNRGCTYTKWRCIEECKGDLFGFLDADDTLQPEALECMTKAHRDNPDAAIVSSRHYLCDEHLNTRYESRLLQIPSGKDYLTNGDFQPEAFVTFKTFFYKKTQGLNKSNPYGDDQELLLLMEEVGDWIVLDKFLYKYRISNDSVSHGDDNYICLYWNIVVYHQACIRRGLDPSTFSYKVFYDFIKYQKGTIAASKEYRLGNLLLHPKDYLKRRFSRISVMIGKCRNTFKRFRYRFFPYKYKSELYKNSFLSNSSSSDDSSCLKSVDKVIYCFWTGSNEMSENRKRCYKSIIENAGVTVKLITTDNLSEYILPDHPLHPAFKYLSLNHRSDYLRCYFMHFYGGGFCDIKTIERSWVQSFDRLNSTTQYILGYPELNSDCTAQTDIESQPLKKEVIKAWPLLIGNGAFVCRPQTKFTYEWYTEQNRRLDLYYDSLKEHPAIDPFGQTNDYPLPWLHLQGGIFHPLCLKYHKKIIRDSRIMPLFTNYR